MDFSFPPETREWQDRARDYADEHLKPRYGAREREGAIEPEVFTEMGRVGFIAPELPHEFGGRGASRLETGAIIEQLARGDFNVAYTQVVASLVGQLILRSGSDRIQREWLPRMTSGTAVVGIGLTEPHGGSDAGAPRLTARRVAAGWELNGTKSMSFLRNADGVVVFAKTDPAARRGHGISAFFVPLDLTGTTREPVSDLGTRAVTRGLVHFERCTVPDDHLLGEEGTGFSEVMQGFDFSRALIALQCLAVAELTVEETWQYTSGREAFGQPLSKNQGVAFPLAEAATKLAAAKLLGYQTLWLKDQGQPHTTEAAMVKSWAPQLAVATIHECLLLHGQRGYTDALPIGQRLRDVIGLEIGDGTAQIMKLIIARGAVGRDLAP